MSFDPAHPDLHSGIKIEKPKVSSLPQLPEENEANDTLNFYYFVLF